MEDSIVLIKGKENSFSIKIINSGLADVKFVYLTVNNVNGIKFLSEKEQYIGDINSDDFDSAKFTAFVNENAANTINLIVTLVFKDATNKEFTETKTISLKTYSLKEAQNLGLVKKPNYVTYIVIVVLIIGFIIYRKLKKRKASSLCLLSFAMHPINMPSQPNPSFSRGNGIGDSVYLLPFSN